MNDQVWQCGDNFLNRYLALKGALVSCTRNQSWKINNCCQIHDNCYDEKTLSRYECDTSLEKCFEDAISIEIGLKKFTCKVLISTFQIFVEMFGNRAYNKTI
uniref:Phospholipase A(2) n=1 Tax=Strongyloides venezuelensis TaxID=75913 RepID=A0A0K0FM71_STRVS